MERRPLLSLQHRGHRAAPAVRGRSRGDLREHGIADPGLGGDPLDRDDFRKAFGARDPHLVVLGVVEDERPSLHAAQQQGRPRDAGPERGRWDHRRVGVVQERQTAAQSAVGQKIGLGLRGEPQARGVRAGLALVFTLFNSPWLLIAPRLLSGSMWGLGRIPYLAPWLAWQLLTWIFCALVAVYVLGKGVWWLVTKMRGEWRVVRGGAHRASGLHREVPLPTPDAVMSRRTFLARATYAYAGAGAALSGYGIWSAFRLPEVTRRTLLFRDLPAGLEGLRLLHLSDVHAGIHMEREQMEALVAHANALKADLIVQTGDIIDINPAYIPEYVRAFRDLPAPLGVVTVLGNHDRYTGEHEVVRGVREAGQVFVKNGAHVIERNGAVLALLGIDDPRNWKMDDPQPHDVRAP